MVGSNRRSLLAALALLACVVAAGCGKKKSSGPAQSYTVRAKVERIDGRELTLRHEAIPDFVNAFGEKSGMESMAMPFGAGKDVALDGVGAGDPVEVRFHTDWDAKPALVIDSITRLPPGTKLEI